MKSAVDSCVILNKWDLAVQLAEQHNFQVLLREEGKGRGERARKGHGMYACVFDGDRVYVMLIYGPHVYASMAGSTNVHPCECSKSMGC